MCNSVPQTSLSRDKGQRTPLNGKCVILHSHRVVGWARPHLRLIVEHSTADSGGNPQQAPEDRDLVPLWSGHRGVGVTEVPAAALAERSHVISHTWPTVYQEIVLKSKAFGVRPACALNPAVTVANNNSVAFHSIQVPTARLLKCGHYSLTTLSLKVQPNSPPCEHGPDLVTGQEGTLGTVEILTATTVTIPRTTTIGQVIAK